jgi:hypothetical protein
LTRHGIEHIVLEQASRPANAWRNEHWDSFTLITPNWSFRLPGAPYKGDEPNGFMGRDEIVRIFEGYLFAGFPRLPGQKSGLLLGVAENAELIAAKIVAR